MPLLHLHIKKPANTGVCKVKIDASIPSQQMVLTKTVSKILTGTQSIARWAITNGMYFIQLPFLTNFDIHSSSKHSAVPVLSKTQQSSWALARPYNIHSEDVNYEFQLSSSIPQSFNAVVFKDDGTGNYIEDIDNEIKEFHLFFTYRKYNMF